MDRQAIYSKVRAHLLTQGIRSMSEQGSCLYRGPNGLKCAIGILITDYAISQVEAEYNVRIEGRGVNNSVVIAALEYSGYTLDVGDLYFLNALQSIHDCSAPKNWSARLDRFAELNDLNPV